MNFFQGHENDPFSCRILICRISWLAIWSRKTLQLGITLSGNIGNNWVRVEELNVSLNLFKIANLLINSDDTSCSIYVMDAFEIITKVFPYISLGDLSVSIPYRFDIFHGCFSLKPKNVYKVNLLLHSCRKLFRNCFRFALLHLVIG